MCSNCYNGCTDITSDKCVRYTGIDVPVLGIKTGDSLSYIEQALITFLTSTLDGTGIKLTIDSSIICDVVKKYIPTCEDLTALNLFEALIKATCDLQEQIDVINATLTTLNADYDIDCLSGVTNSSDTHDVLQAVITKLCALDTTLSALALNVLTNYVKLSDLNTLIQAYLDNIGTSTKFSTKMVPYTAVEYYGTLANFDATGAGLGDWENIYLCNGLNGTPDKRGRVPVGAIQGVPGGALAATVNPASDPTFNPNYALGDIIYGVNKITLDATEIPSHTHSITDPGHVHTMHAAGTITGGPAALYLSRSGGTYGTRFDAGGGADAFGGQTTPDNTMQTSTVVSGVSAQNTGGGLAHDNKQPSLACYYIIYLP
jgi:microcystin-dependent protein